MITRDEDAMVDAGKFGIGLRGPHHGEIIAGPKVAGWLEVHPENYLGGGIAPAALQRIRGDYPIALHGVGLSLGSAEGIDRAHAAAFRALADRIEPMLVSEHLSWSIVDGDYLNDLLPLPYTEESLAILTDNVAQAQELLGRRILVENPSTYLRFRHSTIGEAEFLAALVARTGCGLLVDVNNIHVSCSNFGLDPLAYLAALPVDAVGEIHLAGHATVTRGGRTLLIDDHGSAVAPAVWELYRAALRRFGMVPSLVEWDRDLPALSVLCAEADKARAVALSLERADAAA